MNWIKCKQHMPIVHMPIIFYNQTTQCAISGYMNALLFFIDYSEGNEESLDNITHWMPFEKPKD